MGHDRIARATRKESVKVLEMKDCDDVVFYLPTPKSPHGINIDPSGQYIVAGGKLAAVIPVHSFDKMINAIENELFEGVFQGVPVLQYDAVIAGEVKNPGLGPLHTEFDGKGYAYTSAFISSEIVKWEIGTWKVVDRIPTYYSIGHLMIPGGDPELGTVLDRRSPAYVMNMILNPEQMLAEHPDAKAMLAEYMTPMANQNLTEEEARAIVEFFRTAAG